MSTLRRYFVAGLLVWIPLGITLWVLSLLVDLMDQSLLLLPQDYRSEALFGFHVPGLGIILTVAIVLATGALAANLFGRKLLGLGATQPSILALIYAKAPAGRGAEAVGLRSVVLGASSTFLPLAFGGAGEAVGMLPVFWAMATALAGGGVIANRRRASGPS